MEGFLERTAAEDNHIWGQKDVSSKAEGGNVYLEALPHAQTHRLDSGQIAVEASFDESVAKITAFYDRQVRE
jgi:hypothetical protein